MVVSGEKFIACALNAKRVPLGRVWPLERVRGDVQRRIMLTSK